ncbi:MAG: efflux RND transporter periplasmic adaptor subunit [Pirellulaceae bacterium]|nr:efflux RND transporter periplasmic adaptor subunit [Pirellulaceae bacterium]
MPFFKHRLTIAIALAVMLLCQSAGGQSRSSRLSGASSYAPDGVLEPWKTSNVACAEPGLLESLQVKLGEQVSVGQPLATLEASALVTQLAIVEAQAAALGRQVAAKADVELNQRRVEALRSARENRFSSQSELDRAQADLNISQGRMTAEIEEQEILRLQVARLKHQIKQRTVVAPIPGIVTKLHRELGEYVSPTSPEILQIVDVSRLRASFFLQVAEVETLPSNGRVHVRLDDGHETAAAIEYVSPVSDGESALIEVRVLIDNPDRKILGSRCTLLLPDDARTKQAAPRS